MIYDKSGIKMETRKAIIYARVSSSGYLAGRQSTERQVESLKDYAAAKTWFEKAAEQESREAATKRLAEEFMELQKEFPEIKDFQGIPDSVLHQSIGKKISLLDAYLRYQRSEQKKRDQAEASAKAAKESSTGSMQSQAEGAENAIISAALKGVFG